MCGIVGLIAKTSSGFHTGDDDIFTQMLQMDSVRGMDSTGVFGVNSEGKIDLIKANTHGWLFTQCKQYHDFNKQIYQSYKFVVGHNRAATRGAVTASNAHPFKEDHIVLVHNGTIFNKDSLAKDTEVDSHAICKALAKADAKTALKQINGAFALVWYDQKYKTLNLARNSERPLYVLEYDHYYCVSSEVGLPYWLNSRDRRKIDGEPKLVPVEKLLQIRLEDLDEGFTEINYENYVWVPPPVPASAALPALVQSSGNFSARSRHLHMVSTRTDLPKQGDEVIFKIDDMKHEAGDPYWNIFGYPIFNRTQDNNILVKVQIRDGKEAEVLASSGFGKGTVSSVTQMGNMPVIILHWASPHKLHEDKNKNLTLDEEMREAIKQGCTRCKGAMNFLEIADSIVRKKKDGTYRTLCKICFQQSLAERNPRPSEKVVAH